MGFLQCLEPILLSWKGKTFWWYYFFFLSKKQASKQKNTPKQQQQTNPKNSSPKILKLLFCIFRSFSSSLSSCTHSDCLLSVTEIFLFSEYESILLVVQPMTIWRTYTDIRVYRKVCISYYATWLRKRSTSCQKQIRSCLRLKLELLAAVNLHHCSRPGCLQHLWVLHWFQCGMERAFPKRLKSSLY